MAVDNIGTPVAADDLCLLAGRVRRIDGDTLVVVTADGKHAFRVKSTDTRKVDTITDPGDISAVNAGLSGKQAVNANLTALSGLSGAAGKIPKFTGSGAMTLVDESAFVQAAAGAFTTVPPTSAVAAASANDLVRKTEIDATVTSLIIAIAGRLDATLVSAFGLTLIDDASASAARTTLGLGSLATQSVRTFSIDLAAIYTTGMTWSAMPSAHTLAFNNLSTIRRVDLTQYTQCRLRVIQGAAAASGSKLRLRYATSFQTAASGFSAIGNGATEVDVSLSTSTSQSLASSWFDLESAAKADVWVACTGISGNGSTSPTFWSISPEFR